MTVERPGASENAGSVQQDVAKKHSVLFVRTRLYSKYDCADEF